MASRFFKLKEAEELLPVVEALLNTAINRKKKSEVLEAEFARLRQRVALHGGIVVHRERMAGMKQQKDCSASELREALLETEAAGCLVKDLDIGLIDFPCLVDRREVYLCWKLGEPAIGFWHGADEGFDGRKPIDKELFEGGEERPN